MKANPVANCCRLCCSVPGTSSSKTGSLTQAGLLLLEITKTSLDVEKTGNPTICKHCYKEVNALSKRNFDLRRSKEELRAKMKRSDVFFSHVMAY